MRPYLLLAVIGMAGCAFGQNSGGTGSGTGVGDPKVILCPGDAACTSVFAQPAPKQCPQGKAIAYIGHRYKCVDPPGTLKGPKPAKKEPLFVVTDKPITSEGAVPSCQGGVTPYRSGGIWICDPSGPIDVPAIQETRHNGKIGFAKSGEECKKKGGSPMGEPGSALEINGYCEDMLETVTTCADKERVLEHSESGKYWCRRVQP